MIRSVCACSEVFNLPESQMAQAPPCAKCGARRRMLAAEGVGDGEGSADFDARLEMPGEDGKPEQVFLGGVADITFGKSSSHPLVLSAAAVSRRHGRLVRIDFGPSRWKVVDDGSTNGTFVNGRRVAREQELNDGDVIKAGGCELRYRVCDLYNPKVAVSTFVKEAPGQDCPGCGKRYGTRAKVCVARGIDLKTGRAILTRSGVDENDVSSAPRTSSASSVGSSGPAFTPSPPTPSAPPSPTLSAASPSSPCWPAWPI